jgi:hypothetical protein
VGQSVSLDEEAVLADSGWVGEVAVRVGRVRRVAFSASYSLGQHQAPRRQLTKDWPNAEAEGRRNDLSGAEGISPAAKLA